MSNTQAKFYRNKEDLVSLEGIEVEAGSLWRLRPETDLLVLEDEDQYLTCRLQQEKFKEVG